MLSILCKGHLTSCSPKSGTVAAIAKRARRSAWRFGLATVLAAAAAAVGAQTFPAKPITVITPNAPGAAMDLIARSIADGLKEALGPIVVENRPGANQSIGTEYAKRAPADGYTLLVVANSSVISMAMFKNLPWDLVADFEPIVLTNVLPFFLVINPEALPVRNTLELIEFLKARPGKFSYITPGSGATHHLSMELLKLHTGIEVVHVPYKSMARGVLDMIAGRTHLTITGFPAVASMVKAGKLRVLATAGSKRSALLPEVPTIAESGVPGFDVTSWQGLVAPKGTPGPIIAMLNEEANRALRKRAMRDKLALQGVDVLGGTPEEFAERIRSDLDKWTRVVKAAGIKPD